MNTGYYNDVLYWGKRFRELNILDEGTRKCLAIEMESVEDSNKPQLLPNLKQGENCYLVDCQFKDLKTTPPKPYTEVN